MIKFNKSSGRELRILRPPPVRNPAPLEPPTPIAICTGAYEELQWLSQSEISELPVSFVGLVRGQQECVRWFRHPFCNQISKWTAWLLPIPNKGQEEHNQCFQRENQKLTGWVWVKREGEADRRSCIITTSCKIWSWGWAKPGVWFATPLTPDSDGRILLQKTTCIIFHLWGCHTR